MSACFYLDLSLLISAVIGYGPIFFMLLLFCLPCVLSFSVSSLVYYVLLFNKITIPTLHCVKLLQGVPDLAARRQAVGQEERDL